MLCQKDYYYLIDELEMIDQSCHIFSPQNDSDELLQSYP